ncbi:MAG TPA: hypothetical protein VGM92_04845 [Candidatus Kapabacteria bacterium]|jgi:hypothetical protein
MALETKQGSRQSVEDITEWYLAAAGAAKGSTTDAQLIPFVTAEGGIDIEDETTKGPGGEDMPYGQGAKKITGMIRTEASDLGLWAVINAFITPLAANDTVTQDLNGQLAAFGKNRNGEYYNFWQKPNLQDFVGSPACSTAFSAMGSKWHNGNDGRYTEIHLEGWESAAQTAYRAGLTGYDTAAAIAGFTTIGATLVTASRAARVLDKGFHTCTVGGTDMGILTDASFEDELTGGAVQQNKHAVLQHKITAKAETNQASMNQQTSLETVYLSDTTIVMKSYAGETVTVNNARPHGKFHAMGRNKSLASWSLTSTMSLAQAAFTGTTATYTCDAA